MKLFSRMPAEVRAAVVPGDRVLTYAEGPGGHVIATDRALYLGGARLPWFQVDRGVWDEEGLTVVTTDGRDVGEVRAVVHGAAQDLLAVRPEAGPEALVPFVTALVPEVDLAGRRVVVADRPGLLTPLEDED